MKNKEYGGIKMKRRSLLCGILALAMIFSSCAKKSEMSAGSTSSDKAASVGNGGLSIKPSAAGTAPARMAPPMADSKQESSNQVEQNKKIIKNASLYIVEENLINLADSLRKRAEELGGYIESESLMEMRLSARIRIPAQKFDDFITYAEKGFAVKNKDVSAENITDAYVDNEARLNNLKAQEEQVLTILKKANTVEEVLKVQTELYKIRGEAEALEARKKNWDKQVDYASITINADKKIGVVDNKKSILGGSEFFKSIGTGFNNTSVTLVLAIQNLLIFIFSNITVLAFLALAAFFGLKYYKKYNKK
jgi:hypothetical protein